MFKQFHLKLLFTICALSTGLNVCADSFTITFSTGNNDGIHASTSTACSTIVSEGAPFLSGNLVTATNVYHSGSGGLKLGLSDEGGTLK